MLKLRLMFGALAPSFSQQLKDQKLKMDAKELKHFQRDHEAIVRLHIRGLIADAAAHRLKRRLIDKMAKSVKGEM